MPLNRLSWWVSLKSSWELSNVKVQLAILVTGVLLGLVCKWGLSGWADAGSNPSSARDEKVDADAINDQQGGLTTRIGRLEESYVDPLVPPANVLGVSNPRYHLFTSDSEPLIPSVLPKLEGDFSSDERALFEPHGEQVCASGCAVSRHPTKELTKTVYRQLLGQFLREPISEDSHALESLLFYGRQTREMLSTVGIGPLDPQRAAVLQQELARTHAKISIRVVDENGVVRSSLPETSVSLDRRHVFSMNVNKVQPLVTSGTVKRVGLNHLWTRL